MRSLGLFSTAWISLGGHLARLPLRLLLKAGLVLLWPLPMIPAWHWSLCQGARMLCLTTTLVRSTKAWLVTSPLRLPTSAGLSDVLTRCHTTSECAWILWTLLLTNCLYSPGHLIQCKATVLSSQQYFTDTGNPSKAPLTFDKGFTALWPVTDSNRGIVNPFFANLALEATSPWSTPFFCITTVYTAAATPFPLASPKACYSMAWMSCWCVANDWGTVTWLGRFSSQRTQLCIRLLGS